MGGQRRLKAMIGGRDFFSDDDGQTLTFKFRMCRKANAVKITLTPQDTYTIRFIKIGRLNRNTYEVPVKEVKKIEGVYCDQLTDTFSEFTGLAMSL